MISYILCKRVYINNISPWAYKNSPPLRIRWEMGLCGGGGLILGGGTVRQIIRYLPYPKSRSITLRILSNFSVSVSFNHLSGLNRFASSPNASLFLWIRQLTQPILVPPGMKTLSPSSSKS